MSKKGKQVRQRALSQPEVREIVLIPQKPLRDRASAECRAAMERVERRRAAWHHFERKDKTAFVRWRARTFGSLLSRTREVEVEIRECESLVHEVELEMRRSILDPATAYRRVKARRANPSTSEALRRESAEGRRVTEFEQESLFQEWVRKFLGTNPDKMDDAAYNNSFAAFKAHMFHTVREQPPASEKREAKREPVAEEEIAPPPDARVKELYRLLVRRLHPDLRANGDTTASALWHEVQEAYALGDVGRMEILLALSDIASDNLDEQTTLAQLRAVRDELLRALDALERSLTVARKDDAWDFARKGADDTLHAEVRTELERNLASRMSRLAILRKIIADWANPTPNERVVLVRSRA